VWSGLGIIAAAIVFSLCSAFSLPCCLCLQSHGRLCAPSPPAVDHRNVRNGAVRSSVSFAKRNPARTLAGFREPSCTGSGAIVGGLHLGNAGTRKRFLMNIRQACASGSAGSLPPRFQGLRSPAPAAVFHGTLFANGAKHHLPAVYQARFWVVAGGLMSYGTDRVERLWWPRTASLVRVTSLDHLVGEREQPIRHFQAECLGRPDPPPLKWSDLRYVFDIQEDCNGKEAIQARRDRREAAAS
jgi:hypothetical protein